MPTVGDVVASFGDFNGQIGKHIDGFDGVHRGHGVDAKKCQGKILPVLTAEDCVKNMI